MKPFRKNIKMNVPIQLWILQIFLISFVLTNLKNIEVFLYFILHCFKHYLPFYQIQRNWAFRKCTARAYSLYRSV